ncbi:uncharacterized protein LOC108923048 isoform X3 [Scleropages formosus]|uniref:uncharacterized protein LOC108923048 isoform X3 n=1 Tax=Scleropages formosus TaxID=113540 RepID=UPI0010FACDF0|nr:uncharacterized protein LOC108923048 isoform X3 [Scleropages formosus]
MSDQGMRLFAVFLGFPVLLLAYQTKPSCFQMGLCCCTACSRKIEVFSSWRSSVTVEHVCSGAALCWMSRNETVNLKCEVQRGDNVSIQWLERPCGTNSSWVRTMRGFTLSVERGTSREFICTAMNNISQETSNALTVDCHDGAAPEIVSNSGDEPMRRDTASDQIIVLLLCAFASLLVSVTIFLVFFSIAQRKRKTGVMETKVGSFAVRDQQVLQMLKEEVYVDMSLETIARTVPEMSSFGPMEAPWNAQEAETDAIYVPMNTANSKEETVPASEISQPATQPSGEEQVSDVSSGNDRRQVVYAEVNFSSKEQSKCSSSPTVGQSQ